MTTLTGGHNNWWTLDYDFGATDPKYHLSFNRTASHRMSFIEAADYTAKIIGSRYQNLHLLMSGGLDSEFAAESLYRNHVPFVPVVGFVSNSNNYDYFYAMHWCQQRNIKPWTMEFVIDDMRLQTASAKVCRSLKIKDFSFLLAALIDEVKKVGGTILSGETSVTKDAPVDRWDRPVGDTMELASNGMFTSMYTQAQDPGEFLLYTPELLLAQVVELDTSLNNALAKSKLYNVPFRPKTWPPQLLHSETKHKIYKICQVEHIPVEICQQWDRQELINSLTQR